MAQRLSDIMSTQPTQGPKRLSDVVSKQPPKRLNEVNPDRDWVPIRFGKKLINIFSKSAKEIVFGVGGGKIVTHIVAAKLNKTLKERGIEPPSQLETQKRIKQMMMGEYEKGAPEFKVTPATTVGEKATDIAAGVTGFVAQLALLKKVFPGAGGAQLWEMENLSSGGMPGVGAATYGVFSLPGKVIKGATIGAKFGRVASESVLLGGMSATHQKIETGEINASEVLISAGIPLGLRAAGGAKGVLKRALKTKNPKAIKAVNKIIAKDINVYKTTDNSRKGITEAEVIRKGDKYVDKVTGKDVILDQAASGSAIAGPQPLKGIDAANKKLLESTAAAKALSKTEVKAAHKVLRRRQAGRGIKATKAAIRAGRPVGEALRAGRRAYSGQAKVPKVTPPDLTDAQWEGYHKKILEIYPLKKKGVQFQRTNTQDALDKLRGGDIPTNYDFGLLDKLLGRETTLQLHTNLARYRTYGIWDVPVLARDALKSMFGWDPQAWRQLAGVSQRHPVTYGRAAKANLQAYASKVHANRINKAIETSPNYKIGKEKMGVNYLGTTPWSTVKEGTRLQQYGTWTDFLLTRKNKVLKAWGRGLAASERGANAGMNTGLNGLVGSGIKDLELLQGRLAAKGKPPMTSKQVDKYLLQRGHDINAVTKRVTAKNPNAKEIQRAANWILFSSAHTVSRPIAAWRSIKNLATGKSLTGRTYAAQITVSNIAKLSLLSSVGAYIGHKWRAENPTEEPKIDSSMNPLNSMWGKYRVGNDVIDLSGGDNSTYRLLARIGVSAYLASKKQITGEEQTTFKGWKVTSPGEEIKRYLNSRETVLLGLSKTLATGKDWMGKPIGRKEAILKQFPMEFLVSVVEAGNADGMWESLSQGDVSEASKDFIRNLPVGIAGLAGAGTATYPVKAATTRYKFRDIVAKGAYNKKWGDLTIREQGKLSRKYRKQFDVFERKIKVERLKDPGSIDWIREEQRKSGDKIRGLLSKSNREKVAETSINISRSPKRFYLNDKKYQRYQELTAKYLNERLSKIKLEGRSSRVRDKLLEITIRMAKNKAFRDIKMEMK